MHEEFELASSASSVEQLEYASLQLARRQGFERFRLSVETPAGPRTRNPFQTAYAITRFETHNLPSELVGSWADLCVLDPIVKRHRQSLAPIAWGRAEYVDAGALERWTLQARFGFAKGLIASCPRSDGSIVFFEMAKSDSAGWSVANMRTDLALGALFAACAADAAHTLLPSAALASDARGKDRSGLTPREIECLRWSFGWQDICRNRGNPECLTPDGRQAPDFHTRQVELRVDTASDRNLLSTRRPEGLPSVSLMASQRCDRTIDGGPNEPHTGQTQLAPLAP